MMDSLDYTLFPNFHPWGAFNRIVYRFRPNGDDHRSAIMEVLLPLAVPGRAAAAGAGAPARRGRAVDDAPELGMLAKVFEQDTFNMCNIQLGLETTFKPGITLGNYQESKIRWLHELLGEWVEGDADECGGRRRWRCDEGHRPPVQPGAVRAGRRRQHPRHRRTGARGMFAVDGHWLSGELRECDPQLCGWVGGPQIANHRTATIAKDLAEELDTPLSD